MPLPNLSENVRVWLNEKRGWKIDYNKPKSSREATERVVALLFGRQGNKNWA